MASLSLSLLLLSLSLLPLLSAVASPKPSSSLLNAAETLANSGYTAMSLTLDLISPTLPLPSSPSLTIFSPPDSAFSISGQPSLSLLLLHFSPLSLSPSSLLSLPFSSSLPSLSPSHHLTITSSFHPTTNLSINNLPISNSPLYDDGFVLVYSIPAFFDLHFSLSQPNSITKNPKTDFQCRKLDPLSRFSDPAGVLKSRGYMIFASFLELQLMGFGGGGGKWTVFAPVDEELVRFSGDFMAYSGILMRHVVPCKVGWGDLDEMGNGTVVSKNVEGFGIVVTRGKDDEVVMVNGVEITVPDMYDSEWLVVHGIGGVIALPAERLEMEEEEGMEFDGDGKKDKVDSDREEF